MKNTLATLCAVLVLSALSIAQSNTPNPLPNTVFVGADGKFETAPDTALIQLTPRPKPTTPKKLTTRPRNKLRPRARFCARTASIRSLRKSASSP